MSVVVLKRVRGGMMVVGMLAAAMVGGLLAGWLARATGGADSSDRSLAEGLFKAMNVKASATYGQEGFMMATGDVDSGFEGVWVLDSVTGEIYGGVLNPQTRKFTGLYNYSNLVSDLKLEGVKNPKFVMVTGSASLPVGRNGSKLGRSILYIGELNSGKVAAYGTPYDQQKLMAGYKSQLVPIDMFQFRQANVIRQ